MLASLEASPVTLAAWCLHPLVQCDDDLVRTLGSGTLAGCDPAAVALAMAYRERANAHLSHHRPAIPDPGPLIGVRQMLIADKVQNRKDFERWNQELPNAPRLRAYFAEWLQALGIDEARYERLAAVADGD